MNDKILKGKKSFSMGTIAPLRINCGTVNNNIQFVVIIAFLDEAEASSPKIPPMNVIRKKAIA